MKRSVIFDVDGTLLDTEKFYMEGWRRAGAIMGYPIPDEILMKTRGVNKEVALPLYQARFGEDFPFEEVRAHRIRFAEEIINAVAPEQLRKPGAMEALEPLRQKGFRLAVASATGLELSRSHLSQAGLLDFFQAVITGDMVEKGKPAPDMFLLAARKLGCTPEECIVVGDSPADVFAASAAGMDVYLIPDQIPANPDTRAKSRQVLNSLEQLLSAMEEDGCVTN